MLFHTTRTRSVSQCFSEKEILETFPHVCAISRDLPSRPADLASRIVQRQPTSFTERLPLAFAGYEWCCSCHQVACLILTGGARVEGGLI